jgi:hypothetical protein
MCPWRSVPSLLDHFLMLGQEQYNYYDPPTWSLNAAGPPPT